MRPEIVRVLQRLDRLAEQLEAVLVERITDACGPLHLLAPLHQVDVVFLIVVDAIATRILRRRTRAIRGREQRSDVFGLRSDRHRAYAHAEPERAFVPDEPELADDLAEVLGGAQRLFHRAALEKHTELVPTEARERVAPANLGLQERADLLEQRVSRIVTTSVVHDLEL